MVGSLLRGGLSTLVLALLIQPSVAQSRVCSDFLTLPYSPALSQSAEVSVPEDIRASLESLFAIMEQQYAPLALKEHTLGLNWEALKQHYRERMRKASDSREAMFIYADVLNLMNDAHVGVRLPSSLTYSLPIQIFHLPQSNGERGPLVLSHVNPALFKAMSTTKTKDGRLLIPLSSLPTIGDTVVKIQGMEPDAFFSKYMGASYEANGNELTNYSTAALGLSHLRESSGVDLSALKDLLGPDLMLTLTLKRFGYDREYTFMVPFIPSGYGMVNFVFSADGKMVQYPEGLEPYDPDRVYVPSGDNAPATVSASTEGFFHRLRRGFAETNLIASTQDIALRLNSNFRAFDKLMSKDLVGNANVAQVAKLSEKMHELFNLGSEALSFSFDEPTLNAAGEVVIKESDASAINIGHSKPLVKLPKDFKRIQPPRLMRGLLNSDSFFAGTFEHNGKRVGYLRIPSYNAANIITLQFGVRYYLGQLEQQSDYLIFDQINNPGGYVYFSDLLVKGFTGEFDHDKHMKFAVRPTNSFLQQMHSILHSINEIASTLPQDKGLFKGQLFDEDEVHALLKGVDEDKQRIYRVLDKDYQESDRPYSVFEDGLGLTEPVSLSRLSEFMELVIDRSLWDMIGDPKTAVVFSGVYKWLVNKLGVDIFDRRIQYTKPVYMWINDLDFSGGDATPAVLQDYGRVKLVGVRTAGAGGTVDLFNFHRAGETDFSTSLTTSLMVRNRQNPNLPWWVENEGVHPDIRFAIEPIDIATEFEGTLARLLKAIGE